MRRAAIARKDSASDTMKTDQVRMLLAELKRLGTAQRREEMATRYGIHTPKAFGVAMDRTGRAQTTQPPGRAPASRETGLTSSGRPLEIAER